MTRKRFVKLLMSDGIQRNEAQRYANYVGQINSYSFGYSCWYVSTGKFAKLIVQSMNAVSQYILKVYNQVISNLKQINKTGGDPE